MKKLRKARVAMNVVGSLVFSVGMLGLLAGTAGANPVGNPTFCDPATTFNHLNTGYDNTDPQPHGPPNGRGAWADLRHGSQIFAVYDANPANCLLELIGSVGSAGDMWITLLDPPYYLQTEPILGCPTNISAEVRIKKYDNRKAVGFVTNYDAATGKGLFLGLYDNGNTDALTLSTFEATGTTAGKLTSTVVTLPLGGAIQENEWYSLQLQNLCVNWYAGHGERILDGPNIDPTPMPINASLLPITGIPPTGQIGIAGYAKSSFVDSSVRNFLWFGNIITPP